MTRRLAWSDPPGESLAIGSKKKVAKTEGCRREVLNIPKVRCGVKN